MIKLIKLLIIGNILYLLYDLWINQYAFLSALLQKFDLHNIFYYVVYDISSFGPHLWFIWALIYCYLLFYILAKFSINPGSCISLFQYYYSLFCLWRSSVKLLALHSRLNIIGTFCSWVCPFSH